MTAFGCPSPPRYAWGRGEENDMWGTPLPFAAADSLLPLTRR
jgi:hypothetical protein